MIYSKEPSKRVDKCFCLVRFILKKSAGVPENYVLTYANKVDLKDITLSRFCYYIYIMFASPKMKNRVFDLFSLQLVVLRRPVYINSSSILFQGISEV